MLPLNAGVDLFFVISGFIMVYASRRLFGTPRAGAQFMARRIARIVPLYWLATSLALILLGYEAARGKGAFPGVWEILASFGFIPFARPQDGLVQPVTGVGWTLNYEMFFYAVFALFVGLARTRAVPAVAASSALAVAAGALLKPSAVALAYWSDPIVLEFVLGMIVAVVFESGIRLKPFWSGSVIALALICLTLDFAHMAPFAPPPGYDPHGFIRLFAAGVPMAALFAAIVLVEPEIPTRGRVAAFLILLGDASYALYLFHPFALVLTRKAYVGLGLVAKIGVLPLILHRNPPRYRAGLGDLFRLREARIRQFPCVAAP